MKRSDQLALTGRLETIDERPALVFERSLAHSVERVWRAVSDPDELERWFVARPEWTPTQGERWEAMGEERGVIVECEPPNLLAWSWGEERFRFELRADGEHCLLTFTHVFDDRAVGAQHAAGWETYFARLDAHLAGGYLSEDEAHEPVADWHELYAERFGLDPAVGRRMIAAIRDQGVDATQREAARTHADRR
jgi:uncharacterized protein YndB with AHSA1/START domain